MKVSARLQCSVDECPSTVDEVKAFGGEFWVSGAMLKITVDIHQTTGDGQGVRLHEYQCIVGISKNFVDEPGINLAYSQRLKLSF